MIHFYFFFFLRASAYFFCAGKSYFGFVVKGTGQNTITTTTTTQVRRGNPTLKKIKTTSNAPFRQTSAASSHTTGHTGSPSYSTPPRPRPPSTPYRSSRHPLHLRLRHRPVVRKGWKATSATTKGFSHQRNKQNENIGEICLCHVSVRNKPHNNTPKPQPKSGTKTNKQKTHLLLLHLHVHKNAARVQLW